MPICYTEDDDDDAAAAAHNFLLLPLTVPNSLNRWSELVGLYHQPTQNHGHENGEIVVGCAGEVEDPDGVVGEGRGGEDEFGGDLGGVKAVALVHLGHVLGLGELDVHAVVQGGAVYGRQYHLDGGVVPDFDGRIDW